MSQKHVHSIKSVTTAFSCFLYSLISISRGIILVISLFFVLSMSKASNEKLISLIWSLLSLTNYLLIFMCVHSESTNVLTLRFFPFFILTFACIFNSFSALLCQFGIIYFFWEFTEISYTIPTWDLCQNSSSGHFLYCLHCLVLLKPFVSSLTVFLYSPLWCILLCHIWNIFLFPLLSSSNISWSYGYTCCN